METKKIKEWIEGVRHFALVAVYDAWDHWHDGATFTSADQHALIDHTLQVVEGVDAQHSAILTMKWYIDDIQSNIWSLQRKHPDLHTRLQLVDNALSNKLDEIASYNTQLPTPQTATRSLQPAIEDLGLGVQGTN